MKCLPYLLLACCLGCGLVAGQDKTEAEAESVVLDGQTLKLKFSDGFEKGIEGWKTTDEKNWKLKARGKHEHAFGLIKRNSKYKPAVRSPLNIALIKNVEVSDFVLTFDVRNVKDTGNHRDCCVFFGHQNPQQFYYVHIGKKPDPVCGQIMIVNEKPRVSLTENKKEVAWTSDWHKIKVTRKVASGEIKVYFDDMKTPCMEVSDKTFAKGQIGLGSFDDVNDFDNVKIYAQ